MRRKSLSLFVVLLTMLAVLAGCGVTGNKASEGPVITPAGGDFDIQQTVTITKPYSDGDIYYTTDGTEPTISNGLRYAAPFIVSEATTVKARVYRPADTKSSVTTASFTIGDPLPELGLKQVAVSMGVLSEIAYGEFDSGDLVVSTLYGEGTGGSGTFVNAAQGQLVFIQLPDEDDTAVAVAYIPAANIVAGSTTITAQLIADGFIMSNPLIAGYSLADREAILETARDDADYSDLIDGITAALASNPEKLLDDSVFPENYETAANLILDAVETLWGTPRSVAMMDAPVAPVLGTDSAPYVGDKAGPDVVFANPTLAFYGASIDDGAAFTLLRGRNRGRGAGAEDNAITTDWTLGEGEHKIKFTKGFPGGDKADLMAAAANTTKMVQILLDVVSVCPVTNRGIATAVMNSYEGNGTGAGEAVMDRFADFSGATPAAIIDDTLAWLSNNANWEAVMGYLYEGADDKPQAASFIRNARRALARGGNANSILLMNNAREKIEPFTWDLINKPSPLEFCANQTGGVLSQGCPPLVPPTANATFDPETVYVGDTVTFDASSSTDERSTIETMVFRWDFDGDGLWDNYTSSRDVRIEHVYDNPGDYTVFLQVQDGDGLTSIATLNVTVLTGNGGGGGGGGGTGTVEGRVVTNTSGFPPLAGVNVEFFSGASPVDVVTSNGSGTFTLQLPAGTYNVVYTKEGYQTQFYYGALVVGDQTTYLEQVMQIDNVTAALSGTISGSVLNALTGSGVSGLTVELRSGIGQRTGEVVGTATTGSGGSFTTTTVPVGNYTAQVSGSGWTTSYATVYCLGNGTTNNPPITITPLLNEGEFRIILTWGATPSDLDSHLTGPNGSGGRFHVYYSDDYYLDKANLDTDDTSSYGPETITIAQQDSGVYRYYVHDYSNRGNPSSTVMSNSGAIVRVYNGGEQVATFPVPTGRSGTLWSVFEINGNVITPVNTFSYVADHSVLPRAPAGGENGGWDFSGK